MARSFTVGTLVTRAKERADLEGSSFIDDSEWKGYLSTAYAQLHSILAESGLRFFESTQTVTAWTDNGDGGGRVALPSDHFSTVGVARVLSDGRRLELYELMAQYRNAFAGSSSNDGQAFSLVGANLVVYPKPVDGDSYIHTYIPQPTDLSAAADGTSVDVVTPDGEDYIIWTMAMFALAKEESDTSVCERYREQARQRLQEMATMRLINHGRQRVVQEGPWYVDAGDWWNR